MLGAGDTKITEMWSLVLRCRRDVAIGLRCKKSWDQEMQRQLTKGSTLDQGPGEAPKEGTMLTFGVE